MTEIDYSREVISVKIVLTHPDAKVPEYKKEGDTGADVWCVPNPNRGDGYWIIGPGETVMVDLGFRIELPPGWEMQVRSRSGLAKKGLVVANAPGTIDSGYRGPCMVLLLNTISKDQNWEVAGNERIAQFVLKRSPQALYWKVEELSDSDRGTGGFGSTGIK